MKGRGALELGTLSCLMICFTTSNKFKSTHQRITDKESQNANTQALCFTLGSDPSPEWTELCFAGRGLMCRGSCRALHELQHLHQSLNLGWAATGSVGASWAEGDAGVQWWVAVRPPQKGLSWPATLHVHEQHMKARIPNWELCKQVLFVLFAPCVSCYSAKECWISQLCWAGCLIFTSFHPFSSHLHAAIKGSRLVCIVL